MYIRQTPNESGAYPSPQRNPAPGLAYISDEQVKTLIEYNGFVTLDIEDDKVTEVKPNIDAWEKWREDNPPEPEPVPVPTLEDRMSAMESAMLTMMMEG